MTERTDLVGGSAVVTGVSKGIGRHIPHRVVGLLDADADREIVRTQAQLDQ